jgi:hypothetical protein
MRDSDTYQAILDEGRVEEEKDVLLSLGQKRFGPADKSVKAALAAIEDLARLRRMRERLLDVSSWEKLLALR